MISFEYTRQCIECGETLTIRRKRQITPAQERDVKKYCPKCLGKRLSVSTVPHPRKENRYIDSQGYVQIKVNGIHVPEHRHVMEQIVGRKLNRGEVVHHIDGNKVNNTPSNLVLYKTSGEHSRDHFTGKKRGS